MSFKRAFVAGTLCLSAITCLAQATQPGGAPASGARQIWLDPSSVPDAPRAIPANAETDAIEARINATFEELATAKTQRDIEAMEAAKRKMKADFEQLKAKRLLIQAGQDGQSPGAALKSLTFGPRPGSAELPTGR